MEGEFTKEEAVLAQEALTELCARLGPDAHNDWVRVYAFILAARDAAPTEAQLKASKANEVLIEDYKQAKANNPVDQELMNKLKAEWERNELTKQGG